MNPWTNWAPQSFALFTCRVFRSGLKWKLDKDCNVHCCRLGCGSMWCRRVVAGNIYMDHKSRFGFCVPNDRLIDGALQITNMYEGTTSPMFWPCSLTPTIVFLQSIPWPKLKRFPHPQCQVKSASCWGFTDSNMYVSCWFLVDMGRIGEACYQPFSFWDKCDTRWCRGIWRWWHYQ